jgi:hypothetical protein
MIEGEHWEGVAEELDDMFLGTARFRGVIATSMCAVCVI